VPCSPARRRALCIGLCWAQPPHAKLAVHIPSSFNSTDNMLASISCNQRADGWCKQSLRPICCAQRLQRPQASSADGPPGAMLACTHGSSNAAPAARPAAPAYSSQLHRRPRGQRSPHRPAGASPGGGCRLARHAATPHQRPSCSCWLQARCCVSGGRTAAGTALAGARWAPRVCGTSSTSQQLAGSWGATCG
jgi:hypothetical protein